MNTLTFALLLLSYSIGPATLISNRCSHCVRLGVKSTVRLAPMMTCTLAMCVSDATFDENGKPIPQPPCNTCYGEGRCSRGHEILYSDRR